ncbi:MAG: hypothetical protein IJY61_06735 [Candidatus Gastranaerophilales bacterium]|nr:hypothetical protein [Candidatus Gastranaerophilales bacterium]
MTIIIGIKLPEKNTNAVEFQKILTEFNCTIKMRIGINNSSIFCSSNGIILLQIENTEKAIDLEKELLEISGIEIQRMIF